MYKTFENLEITASVQFVVMRFKHLIVVFLHIIAISRIIAENVNDKTDSWDPYKIDGITYHGHKIPRPIPAPSYIGLWQHPIENSTTQYEDEDASQNVQLIDASNTEIITTVPFLTPDPSPATPINPSTGPSLRPTLASRPILRPSILNSESVLIQNSEHQRPYPDNQAFFRPTLPTRPILHPTTTVPIQFPTSELPLNNYQPGRPMSVRPILPIRPIPRPIPQPALINILTTPNPTIQPVTEPIPSTEIREPTASETVVIPSQTERPILLRPTYPMRPIPRPVPRPTLINIIHPENTTPFEQILETTKSTTEFPQTTEVEQSIVPPSYPIQPNRPILPIMLIPRPIPQPTLVNMISPTNPTQIEPESSNTAPETKPAPSSEHSVSSFTESPVTPPRYPNFQRPIIFPPRPILQPTLELLSTTAPPPPGTEAPSVSTEEPIHEIEITTQLVPLPELVLQPLPDPQPTSDARPISPVGRPTLHPRPTIEPPSNNVIVVPRPIPSLSLRPEPLIPKPITARPTVPSRPIITLPSYDHPINRPIFPSLPPSEIVTEYPNTTPIIGKTVADTDIVDDSELAPAINTHPSTPVPNKPSYEIVTYPQRPLLPPASSSPIHHPVHSYVPAPIDIGILKDYRCPRMDGYFSIANECDTYVECKTNIAVKYSCPDGLHFNLEAKWPEYPCAYPSEVKCNMNAVQHAPHPTALCPRQQGYFPSSDGNCSRFILCQEGMATIMNCPSGLAFNPDKSSCDWPANVPTCRPNIFQGFTCPMPPAAEDGSPSEVIYKFRFRNRCREYIACQHGHPRLLSCDPGLRFDESSKSCISSDYVTSCE